MLQTFFSVLSYLDVDTGMTSNYYVYYTSSF